MNRLGRSHLLRGALVFSGAALLTAATWTAFRYGFTSDGPELPVLGTVPQFTLSASNGRPLSQRDLGGSIWIADFIFTRCGSICPTLSAHMAKIQTALARSGDTAVRLVSFSVDPKYDTPEVLQEYAARFHADPQRWIFLTGERDPLYRLIGQGFRLAVADRPESEDTDAGGLITHSDRFVLVDADLRIRGYYHGSDDESVQQLLRDVKKLSAVSNQLPERDPS